MKIEKALSIMIDEKISKDGFVYEIKPYTTSDCFVAVYDEKTGENVNNIYVFLTLKNTLGGYIDTYQPPHLRNAQKKRLIRTPWS